MIASSHASALVVIAVYSNSMVTGSLRPGLVSFEQAPRRSRFNLRCSNRRAMFRCSHQIGSSSVVHRRRNAKTEYGVSFLLPAILRYLLVPSGSSAIRKEGGCAD